MKTLLGILIVVVVVLVLVIAQQTVGQDRFQTGVLVENPIGQYQLCAVGRVLYRINTQTGNVEVYNWSEPAPRIWKRIEFLQ